MTPCCELRALFGWTLATRPADRSSLFHHINADRLWAHWQAIHPEAPIFNDTYRGRSRFATRENTLIDNRSPLEPFFQKSGSFHTSLSVLSYGSFGYTYSGLEFWAKSQDQMRQDAMRTINQLYGPRRGASAIKALALGGDEVTQQHQSLQRYFVKLQVDRSEVERPCSVNVYLDDHRAGSWVISQQPEGGIAQGGFTIDKAIHDTGKHQSSVEDTTKSIKNSLRVEIETVGISKRSRQPPRCACADHATTARWEEDRPRCGTKSYHGARGRRLCASSKGRRVPSVPESAPAIGNRGRTLNSMCNVLYIAAAAPHRLPSARIGMALLGPDVVWVEN